MLINLTKMPNRISQQAMSMYRKVRERPCTSNELKNKFGISKPRHIQIKLRVRYKKIVNRLEYSQDLSIYYIPRHSKMIYRWLAKYNDGIKDKYTLEDWFEKCRKYEVESAKFVERTTDITQILGLHKNLADLHEKIFEK